MNVQALHHFVASVPGTFGEILSRRMAVNMVAAGRPGAAGALVGLAGPAVVPALVEAGASPTPLREAISHMVLYNHKALPALIRDAGGRDRFAAWCRRAEFELPHYVPGETVTIARGTIGISPEENVAGLHWSIGCPGSDAFDGAAFFAAGGVQPVVTIARVPRSALVYFVEGTLPYEVLPEAAPDNYEVVTDTVRIGDAATRFAYHARERLSGYPLSPGAESFDRFAADLIAWWEGRRTPVIH